MKNYQVYRLSGKEWLLVFLQGLLLSALVAWLFYKSIWAMLLFLLIFPVGYDQKRKRGIKKQQQELEYQFQECIRMVTDAMRAGYSAENAFSEAQKELIPLLGEQALIIWELRYINQQVKLNVALESLLQDLARRSGIKEIASFGQVFGYAKRSGGDFIGILKDTSARIHEKNETEREIHTVMAAKKMEQSIMNAIPLAILLFVEISSPGFFTVMYESMMGKAIMSGCLLLYALAYILSLKIVNIRI